MTAESSPPLLIVPGPPEPLDVHVSELRRKLGPDAPAIETVKGVGYRLVPPARERLA